MLSAQWRPHYRDVGTLLLAGEHFVLLVRVVAARLAADHDVVAEVRIEAERRAAVYDYLRRLFIQAHNSLGREDGQATFTVTEAIRIFVELEEEAGCGAGQAPRTSRIAVASRQ